MKEMSFAFCERKQIMARGDVESALCSERDTFPQFRCSIVDKFLGDLKI